MSNTENNSKERKEYSGKIRFLQIHGVYTAMTSDCMEMPQCLPL